MPDTQNTQTHQEGRDGLTREELHFRQINMRGWRRSDGLFEVEGRVTDRKPHEFKSPCGSRVVAPNEPIHDMVVKLVFDEDMMVHEVSAFTEAAPYGDCFSAGPTLQSLKGLHISRGWSREIQSRLGGAQSCTHLMEILLPMGTTAFQSLTMLRISRPTVVDVEGKPRKVDSCYAYAANREIVLHQWPAFYTGPLAPSK